MNKEQIDLLFFIIHNKSDKGKITVNFRNHDGDHDVDLYSIWWSELREILQGIDINNVPKGKNYCDIYGEPREEEYLGIGQSEIKNLVNIVGEV